MAVRIDEVRQAAALARVALDDEQAAALVADLNGILAHMRVLDDVDTSQLEAVSGVGAEGMPLRADRGSSTALEYGLASIAPVTRDGFFLVPRLATHEHLEGE